MSDDLENDIIHGTNNTKTHNLRIDENRIYGFCDEVEALKQTIYKIINTERYKHIIYSHNYGIELNDLFGKNVYYVIPELDRRIRDALIQDDRINDVVDFKFEIPERNVIHTTFTVVSIYGNVEYEKIFDLS